MGASASELASHAEARLMMAATEPLSSPVGILGPAILKSSQSRAQDYPEPDEDYGRFNAV